MKIRKNNTIEYILDEDKELPKSEQTIWRLRIPSAMDRARLSDAYKDQENVFIYKMLILAIVSWENLFDQNGEELKFSDYSECGILKEDAFESLLIPSDIVIELYHRLAVELRPELEKKS